MKNKVRVFYENYWKNKKGLENFLFYQRNIYLKNIFQKGEKVLDLASGEGAVSEFIKSLGCDVIAFDISKEALKKAKQRGIKIKLGDVEKELPFAKETFDGVFWGDNIEHLFSPLDTLKEVNRILKERGKLIISCPNMGYWRYRLYYLFYGMIPQTEWSNLNPWEWEHIRFFNCDILKQFLDKGGFMINKIDSISQRRLDQSLLTLNPTLFGMIFLVQSVKNDKKN